MTAIHWERVFKETIIRALCGHKNNDGPLWSHVEAVEVADCEFSAVTDDETYMEEDPFASAQECMSYWEAHDGQDEDGEDEASFEGSPSF